MCLNVYDVSRSSGVWLLNQMLAHGHAPWKLGGIFHAGVEVHGLEWSFGSGEDGGSTSGISCHKPRQHPQHHFRQTVRLRRTWLSKSEITNILSAMLEEYPGGSYDLLQRNCCHFADDLCSRLGAGCLPDWVHRLARTGAAISGVLPLEKLLAS